MRKTLQLAEPRAILPAIDHRGLVAATEDTVTGCHPGPAGHDGDYQPGRVGGAHEHDKVEVPRQPRKNLAADQKSMREDVQQLVRTTQELKNAMEGFGPKQPLSAEMIGKTKEIEKLAHDIAELAKG